MLNQLEIIKKASILIEKKKFIQAKQILIDFQKNAKNLKIDIKFYYSLYLVSEALNETQNAKKNLEKCLKINKDNHIVLNNLGNIFLREGKIDKAEQLYLNSHNLKNDYLLAIVNLAILYQNTGKLENAKKFYKKAIELSPGRISIYFNLSRIDKNFINEEKIIHLSNLIENEKDLSELSYGYFLLAENERKKKNFDLEIDYLQKANQFSFNSMKEKNLKTLDYWKNVITKKYNKFSFNEFDSKNELEKFKPIFIIGLPRSGSTITEVLLSSGRKKIKSLGESSIFNGILAKGFSNKEDLSIDLNSVKNKIIEIFQNKNFTPQSFFIDKSLENFFYIEVILKIFPNAIFINTTRNIEDNIIAIFKQSLSKLSWTHSLEDILNYIDTYLKVIDNFEKKYPNKILSISLEELSNNIKDVTKKLYNFCDLEWTEDVLEFHKRQDLLISTASNIQIRGQINKYDNKKYEPYKIVLKNFFSKYDWLN